MTESIALEGTAKMGSRLADHERKDSEEEDDSDVSTGSSTFLSEEEGVDDDASCSDSESESDTEADDLEMELSRSVQRNVARTNDPSFTKSNDPLMDLVWQQDSDSDSDESDDDEEEGSEGEEDGEDECEEHVKPDVEVYVGKEQVALQAEQEPEDVKPRTSSYWGREPLSARQNVSEEVIPTTSRRSRPRSRSCDNVMPRNRSSSLQSRLAPPRAKDLQASKANADWVEQKPLTKRRPSFGSSDLVNLLDGDKREILDPRKANRRSRNAHRAERGARSRSCTSLKRSEPRSKEILATNHLNENWDESKPLTKRRPSHGSVDLLAALGGNNSQPEPRSVSRGRSLSAADLTTMLDHAKFSFSESKKALMIVGAKEQLISQLDPDKFSLKGSKRTLMKSSDNLFDRKRKSTNDVFELLLKNNAAKRSSQQLGASPAVVQQRKSANDLLALIKNSATKKNVAAANANTSSRIAPRNELQTGATRADTTAPLQRSANDLMADMKGNADRRKRSQPEPNTKAVSLQRRSANDLMTVLNQTYKKETSPALISRCVESKPECASVFSERRSAGDLLTLMEQNQSKRDTIKSRPVPLNATSFTTTSANDLMALLKQKRTSATTKSISDFPASAVPKPQTTAKSANDLIALLKQKAARTAKSPATNVQPTVLPSQCKSANDLMGLLNHNTAVRKETASVFSQPLLGSLDFPKASVLAKRTPEEIRQLFSQASR